LVLAGPNFGKTAVIGFAIGTLVGGLVQLLVQLPSLKKVGFVFGFDFNWKDSGVRQTLQLMWPAIISGSVVQVSVMLNAIFASYVAGDGPVTWLYSAFRLMQLPLDRSASGSATASLPSLARLASNGITDDFRHAEQSHSHGRAAQCAERGWLGHAGLADHVAGLWQWRGGDQSTRTPRAARSPCKPTPWALSSTGAEGAPQPASHAIQRRFILMIRPGHVFCVILTATLNYIFVIRWHLDHRCTSRSPPASAPQSISAACSSPCASTRVGSMAAHSWPRGSRSPLPPCAWRLCAGSGRTPCSRELGRARRADAVPIHWAVWSAWLPWFVWASACC